MSKTPEEMAKQYADTWNEDPEYRIAYDSFLSGYKAARQWISVKDRLPEVIQELLISYGQKPFFFKAFLYHPNHPKKDVKMFCGKNNTNYSLDYVTHWMPLPAPPKEEK